MPKMRTKAPSVLTKHIPRDAVSSDLHFLDTTSASLDDEDIEGGRLGLLEEGSAPNTELRSTEEREIEQLAYMGRNLLEPRIAFAGVGMICHHPGWTDTVLVCYLCYGKGHMGPRCSATFHDFAKVFTNFEALPAIDKKWVLDNTYQGTLHLARLREVKENNKRPSGTDVVVETKKSKRVSHPCRGKS